MNTNLYFYVFVVWRVVQMTDVHTTTHTNGSVVTESLDMDFQQPAV